MSNITANLSALGNKVDGAITKDGIERFPAPAHVRTVKFVTHEFTSLCPVTNQPDLYTVEIEYAPKDFCVESKTLKLYLTQWRNEGIFGEYITHLIADELFDAIEPEWIHVKTVQQVRGGLQMTTEAHRG